MCNYESPFQIWDWDPESNSNKLLIDVDPLFLANDPALNRLLALLAQGVVTGINAEGEDGVFDTFLHWTGVVLLKVVEIAVEVLL